MTSSLRVEPSLVQEFASAFGELMAGFEGLGTNQIDLGETGDPRLTQAIEHFIGQVQGGVAELSSQFGQLQKVLAASAQGYDGAESHVVSEIMANLSTAAGSVARATEGGKASV